MTAEGTAGTRAPKRRGRGGGGNAPRGGDDRDMRRDDDGPDETAQAQGPESGNGGGRDDDADDTPQQPRPAPTNLHGAEMNLKELKEKRISELTRMARDMGVENAAGMRKQELIFALLQAHDARNGIITTEGVLEC